MKSSSSGLGFTSVLTIVFVTLKLVGTIDWSWWWVLSPLWLGFAIILAIIIGMACVAYGVERWKK
jgi:ABC-type antimicrobial peptide transport system permease subunit